MTDGFAYSFQKPCGLDEEAFDRAVRGMQEVEDSAVFRKRAVHDELKRSYAPHPILATLFSNFGTCLYHLNKYELALKCFNGARIIRHHCLGTEVQEYADMGSVLNNMGACYFSLGKYNNAKVYFDASESILIDKVTPSHPRTQQVQANLMRLKPRRRDIGNEAFLSNGKTAEEVLKEMENINFDVALILNGGKKEGGDAEKGKGKKKKKKPKKKKKKGKKGKASGGGPEAKVDKALVQVSPSYYRHIIQTNLIRKAAGGKPVMDAPEPPPPAHRRPPVTVKADKPELLLKLEAAKGSKGGKKKKKKKK